MPDEIDKYIESITDQVKEKFWKDAEKLVIPEMLDFMRDNLYAKQIVDATIEVSVAETLSVILKNPETFLRLSKQ